MFLFQARKMSGHVWVLMISISLCFYDFCDWVLELLREYGMLWFHIIILTQANIKTTLKLNEALVLRNSINIYFMPIKTNVGISIRAEIQKSSSTQCHKRRTDKIISKRRKKKGQTTIYKTYTQRSSNTKPTKNRDVLGCSTGILNVGKILFERGVG